MTRVLSLRLLVLPVLLVLAGLLAAGVVLAQRSGEASATPSRFAGQPTETEVVELEGTTLEGDRVSLEQFRGTPVFINVWASW